MAKQIRNTPSGFDSDLDAILNRVYGSKANGDTEPTSASIPQTFGPHERHEQDSQELKQALSELRDWRQKSQNVMRMKAEVNYLQDQIRKLKDLRQQIDDLREKLETEPDQSEPAGPSPSL